MKKMKYIFICLILVLINFLTVYTVCGESPTINSIDISPEALTLKTTVTFTVNISGDNISNVELTVSECRRNPNVCFAGDNDTMVEIEDGVYTGEYTLTGEDTMYIEYFFEIQSNGVTEKIEDKDNWYVNITSDTNGGPTNGDTNGNDTNGNGEADEGELTRDNMYASWTPELVKAAHNYQIYKKESGAWAHNTNYIVQLLIDAIEDLGGDVSGFTRP